MTNDHISVIEDRCCHSIEYFGKVFIIIIYCFYNYYYYLLPVVLNLNSATSLIDDDESFKIARLYAYL